MLCCIFLTMLMAPLLRLRGAVFRRHPPPTIFAPPARRPAPGGVSEDDELGEPRQVRLDGRERSRRAHALRSAAATIAVYLLLLEVLVSIGAAQSRAGFGTWALRTLAYVAAGLAALSLGSKADTGPTARFAGPGFGFLVAGITWFELGVLDMHVFRLFEIAGGALGWDLVFHGAGVVAAVAGASVVLWPPARISPTHVALQEITP